MKAIVQDRYGTPDVLRLQEVDRPEVGDTQVLVRVRAASVNPADWFLLTGRPWLVRLESGLFKPRRKIPGRDMAGVVEAVGRHVTQFEPGHEVYGENCSAYAEYVCVPEDGIARKPSNLTFEQAAAVPLAAVTALQGLRDKGRLQPGHQVLVNGASGGVGTFAVQIARALGAQVTAVCSTRNVEMLRALGAEHVVDYTCADFTQRSQRYDIVFDLVGSAPLSACRRLLRPGGVYVSAAGRITWVLKVALASLVWRRQVALLVAKQAQRDLVVLTGLIESGAVTPVIDRQYTLDEIPQALRDQGAGHARGKRVIRTT